MAGIDARVVLTLSRDADRPFTGKNTDGSVRYEMRTLQGTGVMYVGAAGQAPEMDGEAQLSVDYLPVSDFDLLLFRNGADDDLFAGVNGLRRGDKIAAYLTVELDTYNDAKGRRRQHLRFGQATAVELLERAAPDTNSAGRRGFRVASGVAAR